MTEHIASGRQLVLQALAGQRVDRVPVGPLTWGFDYYWRVADLAPWELACGGSETWHRAHMALLARHRTEDEATRIAASTGQAMAFAVGLYGLVSMQFMLVFIAFFVYIGAAQEGAAAMSHSLTQGYPIRAAMITEFHTLSHGQTLRDAANLLLATTQKDFPVVLGAQVLGLLDRNRLLRAMATEAQETLVAGIMDRDFLRLCPNAELSETLPSLVDAGDCALVMEEDRLLGMLTTENVSEFLLLRRFGISVKAVESAPAG